jgi:hypothetical protein
LQRRRQTPVVVDDASPSPPRNRRNLGQDGQPKRPLGSAPRPDPAVQTLQDQREGKPREQAERAADDESPGRRKGAEQLVSLDRDGGSRLQDIEWRRSERRFRGLRRLFGEKAEVLDRRVPLSGEKGNVLRAGVGNTLFELLDLPLQVIHLFLHSRRRLGRGCAPSFVDPREELTGECVRQSLRLLRTRAVRRDPEQAGSLVRGGGDALSEVRRISLVLELFGDSAWHLAQCREDREGREIRDRGVRRSEDRRCRLEPPPRRWADRSREPCADHPYGNGRKDDEPATAKSP